MNRGETNPVSILYVGTEGSVAERVTSVLKNRGIHVGYAVSEGKDSATELFDGYDAVVVNGDREVKTDSERGDEKVVLRLVGDVQKGATEGVTDYVVKAGRWERGLADRLNSHLERKGKEKREIDGDLKESYETVVEEFADAVYVLDENGVFRYVNSAFEELTGYDRSEAIGSDASLIKDTEAVSKAERYLGRVLSDDGPEKEVVRLEIQTKDGEKVPCEDHIAVLPYEGENFRGSAGIIRDVSERLERERWLKSANERLTVVNNTVEEMASVNSADSVREAAAESVEGVYYAWKENRGELERVSGSGDCEGVKERAREAYASGRDIGSEEGYFVTVGKDGVLWSEKRKNDIRLIRSVASSAESALDRVKKTDERTELTRELGRVSEKLSRIREKNKAMRKIVRGIVPSRRNSSISEVVCDALTDIRGWSFAWVAGATKPEAGYEVRAATNRYFGDILSKATEAEGSGLRRVVSEGEPCFVGKVSQEDTSDWRKVTLEEGYVSVASLPVSHSGRTYCVLEVYSEEPHGFEGSHEFLEDVAEVFGYAISSERHRRLSLGREYVDLEISVPGYESKLRSLAERLGGTVLVENLMMTAEGCVAYIDTDDGVDEMSFDSVYIERIECSGSLRVKMTETELIETVREFGGRLRSCSVNEDGGCRVGVNLPSSEAPRDVVGTLYEEYPNASLVSRSVDTDVVLGRESSVLGELTSRQREVLETAYSEGFFETPKEATGEDIAEIIGVSAPTVHNHIRSAEKEILDSFLNREG